MAECCECPHLDRVVGRLEEIARLVGRALKKNGELEIQFEVDGRYTVLFRIKRCEHVQDRVGG